MSDSGSASGVAVEGVAGAGASVAPSTVVVSADASTGAGAGAGAGASTASAGATTPDHARVNGKHYSVVVVGAGIAGATAARRILELKPAASVLVLEATDHVGGRVRNGVTSAVDGGKAYKAKAGAAAADGFTVFDLGAAWTWPSHDRNLATVARLAGVPMVPQPDEGAALAQVALKTWQPMHQGVFSQERRVVGGAASLPAALLASAASDGDTKGLTVVTQCPVTQVRLADDKKRVHVHATCSGAGSGASGATEEVEVTADHVVVAAPPPLVADKITFTPALPDRLADTMRRTPVWMADTAKLAFTFDTPFWRSKRLSGSGFGRVAPMSQVWDNGQTEMAPTGGKVTPPPAPAALVGFVFGDDAAALGSGGAAAADVRKRGLAQLTDMFGGEVAKHCTGVASVGWPGEQWVAPSAETAAFAAQRGPPRTAGHNGFGARELRDSVVMAGRVHLAGTETEDEAGHMEGAAKSGLRVAADIAESL